MPPDWQALGCKTESYGQRLLAGTSFTSAVMTPMLCMTQCQKLGFQYAATEYVDEVGLADYLPRQVLIPVLLRQQLHWFRGAIGTRRRVQYALQG
jgi:hypothetical protein